MQSSSVKILQQKISNTTQIINTLSYTCTDAKHLQTMLDKLEELMKVFKSGLPSSEGLTLQPLSLLKRTWQIKQKYRNLSKRASTYSSLESPLTLQTWTKESSFQIQKQSREKGTLSSQGTSVVISDLSVLQLYLYLAFTVHILYTLQEAESQKHQNITAQTKLLPNRDTGNPGACT